MKLSASTGFLMVKPFKILENDAKTECCDFSCPHCYLSMALFTPSRIAFAPPRKPYGIGLLFTDENDYGGAKLHHAYLESGASHTG